jgi:uncharacterized circularly permuted ATP-grasp superfamily protein
VLRAAPGGYVVQDFVPLSVYPAVRDGALVPRPIHLRPFVFYADGAAVVVPGGVTRVDGRVKDTWVV